MELDFYELIWEYGRMLHSSITHNHLFNIQETSTKFQETKFPTMKNIVKKKLDLINSLFIQNEVFLFPPKKRYKKRLRTDLFYLSSPWRCLFLYEENKAQFYKNLQIKKISPPLTLKIQMAQVPEGLSTLENIGINSKVSRKISFLTFQIVFLLQNKSYKLNEISKKINFSRQRVWTVLTIYNCLKIIKYLPKTKLYAWNKQNYNNYFHMPAHIKKIKKIRTKRQELIQKLIFLSLKFDQKYGKTSLTILEEIGMKNFTLLSSYILNKIQPILEVTTNNINNDKSTLKDKTNKIAYGHNQIKSNEYQKLQERGIINTKKRQNNQLTELLSNSFQKTNSQLFNFIYQIYKNKKLQTKTKTKKDIKIKPIKINTLYERQKKRVINIFEKKYNEIPTINSITKEQFIKINNNNNNINNHNYSSNNNTHNNNFIENKTNYKFENKKIFKIRNPFNQTIEKSKKQIQKEKINNHLNEIQMDSTKEKLRSLQQMEIFEKNEKLLNIFPTKYMEQKTVSQQFKRKQKKEKEKEKKKGRKEGGEGEDENERERERKKENKMGKKKEINSNSSFYFPNRPMNTNTIPFPNIQFQERIDNYPSLMEPTINNYYTPKIENNKMALNPYLTNYYSIPFTSSVFSSNRPFFNAFYSQTDFNIHNNNNHYNNNLFNNSHNINNNRNNSNNDNDTNSNNIRNNEKKFQN
ncbi:hypothetical protein M0812_03886 [Anaeramoeba flamelloides]|uniref:Uncharacterized protein n=1 Tax=Anaeramoeba flamelloides TaxID=1746091 RepID=A0AAV8AH08_9EUKA|nr:hypothetical protein M0812_03886 [Anaeramoeba flamelloides]